MDPSFEIRNLGESIDAKSTLAAALALAAGTQAYATAIRYDNPAGPDHYDWTTFLDNNLDIRMSAADQTGDYVAGVTVNADYRYGSGYYLYPFRGGAYIGYYAGFAQSSIFGGASFARNGYYLAGITPGTMIGGGGQNFDYAGNPYADLSFNYYDSGYGVYTGLISFLTPGLNYIGLQLNINTLRGIEVHYGWLAVDVGFYDLPEAYGRGDLSMLAFTNAVAWGWETDPDTPIAAGAGVPAPGSIGALALGVVGLAGRGRRKTTAHA